MRRWGGVEWDRRDGFGLDGLGDDGDSRSREGEDLGSWEGVPLAANMAVSCAISSSSFASHDCRNSSASCPPLTSMQGSTSLARVVREVSR